MIDYGLTDRVAIVTGANQGIGRAISTALASHGARVLIHYLDADTMSEGEDFTVEHAAPGAKAAEAVCREIRARGGEAVAVSGNLMHAEATASLFDTAEERLGVVNILVNNAAHCELPDTILQTTAGSIDRHFAVNTRAAVLLTAEFARRFKEHDSDLGRIINISTDAAQTFATQISYGASKAALEAFTRSTAIELGPLGITVNAIAPGPVQTGWISSELERRVLPDIPLGRLGTPEDIAAAVTFLASADASWITGQVIKVSGGHAL